MGIVEAIDLLESNGYKVTRDYTTPYPVRVVKRAIRLRFEHYRGQNAKPLEWQQLTDEQKVPWILKAARQEIDDA